MISSGIALTALGLAAVVTIGGGLLELISLGEVEPVRYD
jgi:hypothetical protein